MIKKLKCSSCSKEWYIEETFLNELRICPYCSKTIREKAAVKEFDSLGKVIYVMIEEFGVDILQTPKKLAACLLDAAPNLKKEIRIFFKVLDEKRLLLVRDVFEQEDQYAVRGNTEKLKLLCMEEDGLSENWAKLVGESLLKAAEYSRGIGMPELFTAEVSDVDESSWMDAKSDNSPLQCEIIDRSPVDAFYDYCIAEGFFEKSNYKEAIAYYEKAANKGSDEALIKLALCYSGGIGITKSEKKALDCLTMATKHDSARAKYHLSAYYFQGIGVLKDEKKALRYLIASAKQGCMQAQYNLALRYRFGIGVPASQERAIAYYMLAARQGYVYARHVLAQYCQFGWDSMDG